MIVVFDTNILVSSLFSPLGNEAQALSLFLQRQVVAAVSAATLAEYNLVLTRRKFSFASSMAFELLHLISAYALKIESHGVLDLSPDESDNRFIECAEAASADFLITGNKRHFPSVYGETKIVNAREFLDAMRAL